MTEIENAVIVSEGKLDPRLILVGEDRQREELDLDDGFLHSIRERGILQPLIVRTDDNLLIAGGRRLAAALSLGLSEVPVRYARNDLDSATIAVIELEENIRRKDLPWKDEARAIALLHSIYCERDASWTKKQTSEQLAIGPVHLWLRVADALTNAEECKKIESATGMRAAYNICERIDARQGDALIESIHSFTSAAFEGAEGECADDERAADDAVRDAEAMMVDGADGRSTEDGARTGGSTPPTAASSATRASELSDILCADFASWASSYAGPRFNFIHCDFPYGKRVFAGEWGGKLAEDEFKYEDEPEIYWQLCKVLCENLDRLATPTAHLMFWTASDIANLHETIEFFRQHAPSLIFQPRALTWHKSDNVGIVPDPVHGPRWIVETALMATRGSRPLVKPLASSYSAPTARSLHPSTKPEPVLRHFFGMFVDSTTTMLDPTCGSGSALRAAESLGAERVLGIERSEAYVRSAESALKAFRNLRELTR